MKKFACLVLALAMVFSLSISAGAASPIQALNGTDSQTVTVGVIPSAGSATVYYVDVLWGNLYFQYNFSNQTWNPSTHEYDNAGGWVAGTTSLITVTNHSNAAVQATVTFTDDASSIVMIDNENTEDVKATLTGYSIDLPSAVGTTYADAPAGTATLTISGTPEKNIECTASQPITVTITAA